ncbi:MAG TPA: LpxL/LpxP family Kdo(2)-lipid IV(A) lauroyl/palmitoleoyl acyltransferase [Rudaea sp.]|jgi:KDO2-lipid IV(A) lauroyltransferase|nr:LpxL/LpxP family Kdo(2)-lipid IV(A) lauroyl/palmitoleoyl acyltransferase [Rudaea sp.]
MTSPPFRARLFLPHYWPAWLGVGIMWLLAHLPYFALRACGRLFGKLTRHLPGERRHVAERNIELCFPELDGTARVKLLRATLEDLGMMLAEFALAWMCSDKALSRIPCAIEGLHHLEACRARQRGVLLVGAHFSHLELCARLVSQRIRIAGMYRKMDNDAFEWTILRARLRYAETMFAKDELRATVKYLKQGGTLWYAPDQDMRGKDSVFVPFFGIAASTITATHHLARLSGAVVIPFFHKRLDGGGYTIRLEAPLENFPTDDVTADTALLNAAIERMVREAPAQYLWIHKRFKTRPPGEPPVY